MRLCRPCKHRELQTPKGVVAEHQSILIIDRKRGAVKNLIMVTNRQAQFTISRTYGGGSRTIEAWPLKENNGNRSQVFRRKEPAFMETVSTKGSVGWGSGDPSGWNPDIVSV